MNIQETLFVSVDIETTGLGKEAKILEIGAVKFYPFGMTIEHFDELVHPGIEIPETITAIHGITNEMVKDCPEIEQVLGKWLKFIGSVPLFAHNSPFDFRFLNRDIGTAGFTPLNNPIYDTLKLARTAFPKIKHNLSALCQYLGIPIPESRHRGLTDAILAAKVFESCLDQLKIETYEELNRVAPSLNSSL